MSGPASGGIRVVYISNNGSTGFIIFLAPMYLVFCPLLLNLRILILAVLGLCKSGQPDDVIICPARCIFIYRPLRADEASRID